MDTDQRATEEDFFNLQIGLGESQLSFEDRHFFDIAGYLVLEDLLTADQVKQARNALAGRAVPEKGEVLHIIAEGGALEDAMALPQVLDPVQAFIWGQQYRLVGSRALYRKAGTAARLSGAGAVDPRRYARYRCFGDGQFRCLMLTCLIALDDTEAFCTIPSSHKANLPHPYEGAELAQIPPLRQIPLRPGSGVLFTESLSHVVAPPNSGTEMWLSYQYGPSYMLDWPGCEPSAELLDRVADDLDKAHLLLAPYYHPSGSQKNKEK